MMWLLPGMWRTRFLLLFLLVTSGLLSIVHHFGTDLQFNIVLIVDFAVFSQMTGRFAIQADLLERELRLKDEEET